MSRLDQVFRANNAVTRSFLFGGKNPLSPKEFGIATVKLAIGTTVQDAKDMVAKFDQISCHTTSLKVSMAHLHLIALQAAVFYCCAYSLIPSKRDVLTEVRDGVTDAFTALLTKEDGTLAGVEIDRILYEQFQLYGKSLTQELRENDVDMAQENPFSRGRTAALVVDNIALECDLELVLKNNSMERIRMELIAARNGILLLMRFLQDEFMTFVE